MADTERVDSSNVTSRRAAALRSALENDLAAAAATVDTTGAVRMGAGFCVVSALLQLATMWFIPHTVSLVPAAIVASAVGVTAALLAVVRPTVPPRSPFLLLYPGLIGVSVLSSALVSPTLGVAYTGLLTISFIYIGFTQRRGTALALVPLAAPLWWYCQTGPTAQIAVRLPIAITIWVVVGEVLASRADTVRAQVGRLTEVAATDSLTGLGNRRSLDAAFAGLDRGDWLVLLDLDDFKVVNDTQGHHAGDAILRELGATIARILRATDLAFRFGGEEMVVILRQGRGTSDAAAAWLQRLKEEWQTADRPTFSAGVCLHSGGSPAHTLGRADAALYDAKRAGKDRWHIAPAEGAEV